MIVLDASVLIAHLDASDALHGRATAVLAELVADDFAVIELTLAEVLVGPARSGQTEVARRALERLDVSRITLGPGTAERLADLRAATGLRTPDCCVLAAAEAEGAELATLDQRLAAVAQSRALAVHDGSSTLEAPSP